MNPYLDETLSAIRKMKAAADRSIAQLTQEQIFAVTGPEDNSIALIMKHMAGNLHSRWRDFLTGDGEKEDRNRDEEFIIRDEDTLEHLKARWDAGWDLFIDTLSDLTDADLGRQVMIRCEPHTVLQATQRGFAHAASHVGQIVFLAKHWQEGDWKTLSIPRGQSEEFNREYMKKFQ